MRSPQGKGRKAQYELLFRGAGPRLLELPRNSSSVRTFLVKGTTNKVDRSVTSAENQLLMQQPISTFIALQKFEMESSQ
jgi:hypothetical protein